MPEYFWIILAALISLFAGFAAGLWFNKKAVTDAVKMLRNSFVNIIQKIELLEKLAPNIDRTPQIRSKSYSSNPYSTRQFAIDIEEAAKRLEKIISTLKNKPRVNFKATKKESSEEKAVKVTIDNKSVDEKVVSDNAVNSSAQSFHSFDDEHESYNFDCRYNYETPYEQIIQLYNRGVNDRAARDKFRDEYLITRLGNNKAVEQRLGEVASPEFRKLDNGNFLAISAADGSFYVLPWFDTTLNSSAYNEGGFGYVFDCPDYNPEMAYTVVRVKRPAIFQRDGDNWTRTEKGELILQQ